ncbi:hypothetical protein JYU18_00185 [bacterium AH-315-E07]|nr:hypothetical protein [bacterium AH-315-E07]
MSKKFMVIMAASFALHSAQTQALGLGDIELGSGLNQPFNATIKLVSRNKSELEDLRIGLATNADFDRIGAVRLPFLNGFKFEIITPDNGRPYIAITSTQPVREPFVDFIIEANWPAGRLLREYTVLLDPPTVTTERAAPVQAPSVSRAPAATPQVSEPRRREQTPSSGGLIQPTTTASISGDELVFGPVGSNDTLWDIADSMRPNDSVSVQQMMIALLKENPDAFGDNNINNLKAGETLKIKDQSVIAELDKREALNETSRQYQNWLAAKEARRAARGQLAKQEPVTESAGSDTGSDSAAASVNYVNVESALEGGLRLLADDALEGGSTQGGVTDVEGEVGALRDELELTTFAAEAAGEKNAVLRERMVELEEQVVAMERALQLRNDEVALLQQKLGQTAGDSVDGGASDAGTIEALPPELEQEPEIVGDDVESASDTGGFFSKISLAVKDALNPATLLERYKNNALIFNIVGGVIALLAVMGVVVRRRRLAAEEQFEEFAAPQVTSPELNLEEVEEDEFGIGLTNDDDAADVLNEADVYVSYQRYDKAEAILKYAIDSEPRRLDLKAKLLDVYYAAKNIPAFLAMTDESYAALSDDQTIWSKVNAMGLELAPNHHLFSGDADSAAEFDSMEGFDELSELDDIDASDSDLDSDDYADIDLEMDELAADGDIWQEDESSIVNNEDNVSSTDEQLASGENEISDATEVHIKEALLDLDNELDIDHNLDMDYASPDSIGEVENESPDEVDIVPAKTESLELVMPEGQVSNVDLTEEFNTESSEQSLSLLERAMDSMNGNGDVAGSDEKLVTTNIDDDSLSEPFDAYNPDNDGEDYDPSYFSGVDVVSTKLDLAKAYIDMGDQDGARSILGEVVDEGSDDQKKEAQELLSQL